METLIKKLPADDGMRLVTSMIKSGYIAERIGKANSVISRGITHGIKNGKPYYYSPSEIVSLSVAIKDIGIKLLTVKIDDNGEVREQLIKLREIICLPYIFQNLMGKSKAWQDKRISITHGCTIKGKNYNMLNHFTSEDVEQINASIHTIALTLCSIELTEDYADKL